MSQSFHEHEQFHRLLSGWCEGTLSDSEVEQFDERMRASSDFQSIYVAYMDQHATLVTDLIRAESPLLTADFIRTLEDEAGRSEDQWASPRGGLVLGLRRWSRAAARSWKWWSLMAALLLIGLTLWLRLRGPKEIPVVSQRQPRKASASEIGVLVKVDAVRWEQAEKPHPSEGDFLAEGHLRLSSGRLTLAFLNGIVLTLEGPADLELVSIDRVICHRGKVRTQVPDGAEGFVVSAPGSNVTDMGTEFGLNVEADGRAQIMVFQGLADAAVLEASGSAVRNRSVTKGRALAIDPRKFRLDESEARAESFVQASRLTVPPLALTPAYRDEVLKAQPWGYWRFESIDGGVVSNEIAGRPPLRATGPVRLAGTGNRSVAFEGEKTEQYLLMDGRWSPPRDPGYALELWFSPARFGLAELAGLFVPRGGDVYHHVFQLELTSLGRESILFQRASLRFMHRSPAGGSGGDNLFYDYYVPFRWYHVVTQLRDDRMELYVDGKAVTTIAVSPKGATEACQLLLGQLKPLPRPPESWESRPLVGQIDELAVYDRPLSLEEVRRHHALGAPKGTSAEP
jgi:hypothetical protein